MSQPATPYTSPTQASTADAGGQAGAIDSLLQEASRVRQSVQAAFADIQACGASIGSDVLALNQAAADRDSLASRVSQVDVSAVGGQQAEHDLVTALKDSAAADRDFASWGQDMQNGCDSSTNTQDPNYTAGMAASQAATADKNTFVAEWNPIAKTYGFTQWSADSI
jgi:hypothetical protein